MRNIIPAPNSARLSSTQSSSIWTSPPPAMGLGSRVVPLVMRERMQSKRWPGRGLGLSAGTARGKGRGRGWPDDLGGWTAAPPSHLRACSPLGARWRVPSPRWEEVSERVITVYESVHRDDRAGEGWPVLEVGAEVQRPQLAPCAAKGRMKRLRALELARPAPLGATLPIWEASGPPLSGDNLVVANSRLIATSLLSLRSQVPPRPRSVSSSTSGALGEHRVEHRQMR